MEQVQRFSPDMDEDRDRHNFFPVVVWGLAKTLGITLPETNSSPLKTGHPPKKNHLSTTNFQLLLLLVSGRGPVGEYSLAFL